MYEITVTMEVVVVLVTAKKYQNQRKRNKKYHKKPMILAIVTPLMARAHQHIQQASEIVFCDSTASLDRFNTSVFIISTSITAFGVPLAIVTNI